VKREKAALSVMKNIPFPFIVAFMASQMVEVRAGVI
jgi:hypothetical protein